MWSHGTGLIACGHFLELNWLWRTGRFGIRSIPTMILYRGGREVARVSGALDARAIASWLEPHLA